jgi:hypothetical protein
VIVATKRIMLGKEQTSVPLVLIRSRSVNVSGSATQSKSSMPHSERSIHHWPDFQNRNPRHSLSSFPSLPSIGSPFRSNIVKEAKKTKNSSICPSNSIPEPSALCTALISFPIIFLLDPSMKVSFHMRPNHRFHAKQSEFRSSRRAKKSYEPKVTNFRKHQGLARRLEQTLLLLLFQRRMTLFLADFDTTHPA